MPSRTLLGLILMAAIATLAVLFALPGWQEARAMAILWCMGAALHAFKRHRASRAVQIDGTSIVVDGIEGRIVDGSFVAPWLTIIQWRPEGARFTRTIVVAPDAIDAESFRSLRVILRWCPPR